MKRLNELYKVDSDVLIKGISINSNDINEGDIFVCIKGNKVDRHDYIDDPDVIGPLLFLRQREIIHFTRFKELYDDYKKKGYK